MIDHGATTIWERWDGWTEEHGFQSPWMNSFNHYSLGSVGEWLYRFVLGIDQAAGHGRLRPRLLLRPHPGGSLSSARGSYQSVRGPVSASWERAGGRFTLPGGAPAERHRQRPRPQRPTRPRCATTAGHPPASLASFPGAPGAQEAVFQVGSGAHEFSGPVMEWLRLLLEKAKRLGPVARA